ncbi:hypothetical protein CYY_004655 [Polysphondylium violaceum]|uniref:Lipoprotein n=1 Tax=Polysphondylium violaceum TaxID=133409 RepID=A0A8J4USV3_9MYCE|nr:hypothetical protein CYY_004655 [Polysphondylium violaceum]
MMKYSLFLLFALVLSANCISFVEKNACLFQLSVNVEGKDQSIVGFKSGNDLALDIDFNPSSMNLDISFKIPQGQDPTEATIIGLDVNGNQVQEFSLGFKECLNGGSSSSTTSWITGTTTSRDSGSTVTTSTSGTGSSTTSSSSSGFTGFFTSTFTTK